MQVFGRTLSQIFRQLHTVSRDGPSDTLKRKVSLLEKKRKSKNPRKNQLFVEVPEPGTYLDTASMPMILTAVGVALFAKLLMMMLRKFTLKKLPFKLPMMEVSVLFANFKDLIEGHWDLVGKHSGCHPEELKFELDESKSQEMIERKIKNAPAGQGNVRMLTREEWEEIQEVRPRTPFESKLARPNARVRTGEPLHLEDMKDWTIDVLTDALTRAEETVKRGSN